LSSHAAPALLLRLLAVSFLTIELKWFWRTLLAQVCTGVMLYGYPLIKKLCGGLQV
jgi:hypothetical protein